MGHLEVWGIENRALQGPFRAPRGKYGPRIEPCRGPIMDPSFETNWMPWAMLCFRILDTEYKMASLHIMLYICIYMYTYEDETSVSWNRVHGGNHNKNVCMI